MTVIDTCSLINLARYYLPFDKDSILFNFVRDKIESKDIIIIDHVVKQCGWVNQGEALQVFPYLKQHQTKTTEYLPDRIFSHWLNNDFKDSKLCKSLTPEQFEIEKTKFTNDADVKMLLYCNVHKEKNARIITDETGANNDNKFFKKLPTLCKTMGIDCMSLPEFLKQHDIIHVRLSLNL